MPATAARIGFITQEFRKVVSETASVVTRHGDLARKSDDPIETYFDDEADAQLVADARQTLLSAERRRFRLGAQGLDEALTLSFTGGVLPTARYIDAERNIDRSVLIAEVGFDFARQNADFTIWG